MKITLFERAWGPDLHMLDVSQSHVDTYAASRRSGKLSPLGNGGQGDRKPIKVRDGTVARELRWLSSVFNFGRGHRIGGKRVLRTRFTT